MYRAEKEEQCIVYVFKGWRGESGSSTSDRAPFRRTPSGRDLPSLQLINSRDQFRVFLDFHS